MPVWSGGVTTGWPLAPGWSVRCSCLARSPVQCRRLSQTSNQHQTRQSNCCIQLHSPSYCTLLYFTCNNFHPHPAPHCYSILLQLYTPVAVTPSNRLHQPQTSDIELPTRVTDSILPYIVVHPQLEILCVRPPSLVALSNQSSVGRATAQLDCLIAPQLHH